IYGNGDGSVTQSESVVVDGGTVTDTVTTFNGNGSLAGAIVTTTTNDGLSKTIKIDSTGSGTAATPVFDHITTDFIAASAGGSVETVTHYGGTTSNVIDRTQTEISANGLTTTVSTAFTSGSLAAGGWDRITTDETTVSAGGSLSETITVKDGA